MSNFVKSRAPSPIAVVVSALLLHQLLSALTFPIAKFGLALIEPFTFAFYRFVISSLVLMTIVSMQKNNPPIVRKDYIKIIGLGFLIVPFNQVVFLYGQSLTAAGHAALLFATVPIWVFLAALIHLKERFIIRRAVGIVVGLIGVVVVMTSGAIGIGSEYLVGDAIIIVAVVAWAYYTIWGKPLVEKYGALRITAYTLASGSVLYFPFGLYQAVTFDYAGVTVGAWLSVIYVALGTSVVAYVLWYWALGQRDASKVAVYHNIQPVIASAVAYIFLDEPIGWPFVIGGAIVLTGVIITEVERDNHVRS
ncbi:MAG: DMT family transporter [candidate division Zixibacteria bacterium]|nr:DMT family transporter [candidate division Zixibacteria bacterium]